MTGHGSQRRRAWWWLPLLEAVLFVVLGVLTNVFTGLLPEEGWWRWAHDLRWMGGAFAVVAVATIVITLVRQRRDKGQVAEPVAAVAGPAVASQTVHGPVMTGERAAIHGPIAIGEGASATVVHQAPSPVLPMAARSAYGQQVARIAPDHLYGRNWELAAMAAFCSSPGAGGYWYWRAGAWAGKSALMSWFVLHPPAGARMVSFFITARFAGQSDRAAFLEAVVGQLAELLGEPVPAPTDTSREYNFLDLLDRAAQQCRSRGERLILLVDGLDEDRGVIAGPDAHSIAALLPTKPPHGTRIIVAGRPNPPVPDDVPPDHPLYDPAVIHELTVSEQAQVVRKDMQRELGHLLTGSRADQDLLGLLTAAGGGLSAQDLAELTGQSFWKVREHLATVAGRSFRPRDSHWHPGQQPDVYVLGHEELQTTATERIGDDCLHGYRQQLHDWADTYQHRRWPQDTPEYLLRGYPRLLAGIGDLPRLTDLVTDPDRHDRMLDLTGGDAAALAEVATCQDLVLTGPGPDLEAMLRLCIRRTTLADRNWGIPAGLSAVWVALGQLVRAETLADSLTSPYGRSQSLAVVALALVAEGETDRARELAERAETAVRSVTGEGWDYGRLSVAQALAVTGAADRAVALTYSLYDDDGEAWAAPMVDDAIAAAGDRDQVRQMAEAAARSIAIGSAVTEAFAAVGDDPVRARRFAEQAEAEARSRTDGGRQVRLLALQARAFMAAGDRDRARQFAEQAETVAGSSTDPGVLSAVAEAFTVVGDRDRARRFAEQAETVAGPSTGPDVLTAVAEAFAVADDPGRAVTAAYSITESCARERALRVVAGVFVAAGDADRIIAVACASAYLNDQAEILTAVAEAIAVAGDPDRAETVARSITYPYWLVLGLAAVAEAIAVSGHPGRARQHAERAMVAARSLTHSVERAEALTAVAKATNAAAAVERAEILPRWNCWKHPYEQERALSVVTHAIAAGDHDRAGRTMGAMLAEESWEVSLLVLAEHWPQVVLRCAEELSGNERYWISRVGLE